MAILNFPPATGSEAGKTYEANGVLYTWDGYKWEANSESAFDDKYVNIDGDTMTGDLTVPSLNGGQLAGFRNLIQNGDFRIWQRGVGPTPVGTLISTVYLADRFYSRSSAQTGGTPTFELFTDGNINKYRYKFFGTALGYGYVGHRIEAQNIRHLTGQQVTVSFYSNYAPQLIPFFINSAGATISPAEADGSGVVPVTTVGQKHTATYTVPDIQLGASADTMGGGIQINYPPLVDRGIYDTWNIQLEPGPVATPFEQRPIGTELALCQRYFQTLGTVGELWSQVILSRNMELAFGTLTKIPTMRDLPTADVTRVIDPRSKTGPGGGTTPRTLGVSIIRADTIRLEWYGYTPVATTTTQFGEFTGQIFLNAEL